MRGTGGGGHVGLGEDSEAPAPALQLPENPALLQAVVVYTFNTSTGRQTEACRSKSLRPVWFTW